MLLDSDEIIALVDEDPRGYFGPGTSDCHVEWRPDFKFESRKGWFRDNCTGSTFAINGAKEFGPSPRSMDRYVVEVKNGDVLVNTKRVLQCRRVGDDFSQLDCSPP